MIILDAAEIYTSIRAEIIANHVLMHCISLAVVIALLAGTWIAEKTRPTILSVFLPLLSLGWAAMIVRFDLFIHRQAAYLRELEEQMRASGISLPLWETWKASLRATPFVIPVADAIICAVIVLPTAYLLFGPARQYFRLRQWKGERVYAWGVIGGIILLLCSLTVIPLIAGWRL